MSDWTCTRCGAALEVPSDPAMCMSRCTFCGEDNVAPDVERRQVLQLERLRAEEKQRRDELERLKLEEQRSHRLAVAAENASSNRWMYISIAIGVVGIACAFIVNALVPTPSPSKVATKPTDARSTGKDKVKEIVAGKKKHGCRVINEARTVDDVATISDWELPKGSCVTIVAATGVEGNVLSIQFLDDGGEPVSKLHEGKELIEVFCPEVTAQYGYRITPSATMPYTFEELQCDDE